MKNRFYQKELNQLTNQQAANMLKNFYKSNGVSTMAFGDMSTIRDITEAFMKAIDLLEHTPDMPRKESNFE